MARHDGGAIEVLKAWDVEGSAARGRQMTRDYSMLMLRAYNAEADNLVRGLKPYKCIVLTIADYLAWSP